MGNRSILLPAHFNSAKRLVWFLLTTRPSLQKLLFSDFYTGGGEGGRGIGRERGIGRVGGGEGEHKAKQWAVW